MQFTSHFYNRLLKIPTSLLYSITMLLAFACSAAWWYFWYQPSRRVTNQVQEELHALYSQIDELKKLEKSLCGISQSIDAFKVDVQKKSVMKYRNQQRQQSLSAIVDSATNAGMHVASCRVCGQQEESWCSVNTINGEFKGSLDQMITFFDSLKKSKTIIEISRYEVIHASGETFVLQANFAVYCA